MQGWPTINGKNDFSQGPTIRYIKFGSGAASGSLSDNEKLFVVLHEFGHGRASNENWDNFTLDYKANNFSSATSLTELDASTQAFIILRASGLSRDDASKISDVGYSKAHLKKALVRAYGEEK